jgi:hypothetical protein
MQRCLLYTHRGVCATFVVCVRAVFACARVCVRLRVCVGVCVDAFASVCVRMRAGLCARSACGRGYVCGLSACACDGVRVAVLLRGALGMLSMYWRDIKGTWTVLEGPRGVLEGTPWHSRGTHKLMGHSGVLTGFSHKTPTCVCGCASFGLYTTYHGRCTARHRSSRRTGSTGGVLDEYSRRPFIVRSIAARASAQ